jgi:chorismate mutase/prephenate dehydratase
MALLKEAPSTARAAELAAESESVAALGSEILADLYGLNILKTNVQDIAANQTRFLVMGHSRVARTGSDKTSIMFSAPHEPGALCKVLAELGDHGLNMTKIVSRPSKRTPWEYVFFVDFYGHMDEPGVARALERMSALSLGMKILGSYPPASTMEEDKARDESGFSPINSGLSKSQRIDTQSLANIS